MADQFDPRAWTRDHEGFRDEVYLDSRGLPTVGVGHLITESSPYYGLKVGDKVDPAKLEEEYEKDYVKHEKMAQKNFKNFSKHPKHVQDALVNMTFQLGNKPKKWSNFQAALDKGDYQSAALHGSESDWYHDQTPKRAKSVLDRLAYGSDYSYDRPVELDERPAYAPPERLGLASGALTNPEAGPSDTVPAMLTPGEAVIPASVAQDPEFKPAIEEMVDEGRERNRSAEFLGIPVNHAAAARPPGEQQGYMGGVPHVGGYADGIRGAFDKLLPESVKARWQEAKDTKTGVEDAYSAYKWLDEKDAQLRDMSGGYLGIPTWQDPINWELVGEYGDEALKGARTYGKHKRKAGELKDTLGFQGGTDMIPKPMGAPPKYNIDRPDHGEFNVASDQMGEGMKMDLTNAKHRQQVANKEGDHAQKMQHEKEAAAQKMQLDQMKAEQKLMNDQQSEGMKLQMKIADSDVDGMLTQQKQAALDASINGMGFFEEAPVPQPMAPPPGLFDGSTVVGQNQIAGYADGMVGGRPSVVNGEYRGYADGTKSGAQAQQINDLLAAGVSMEDIKKYLGAQLGAVGDEFVSQPAPPVAQPAPPPQQAPAPTPSNPYQQALGDIQQVAMAQQRRQNATRDIARQAFGAEEEAHAWQSGIDNLQGRADGGMIGDRDIIIDGQFMSSHVPEIQGYADGIQGGFGIKEAFDPLMAGFQKDQAAAREAALAGSLPPEMQQAPPAPPQEQMMIGNLVRDQEAAREQAANSFSPEAQEVIAAVEGHKQPMTPDYTQVEHFETMEKAREAQLTPQEQAEIAAESKKEVAATEERTDAKVKEAAQTPADDATKGTVNDLKDPNTPSTVNDQASPEDSANATAEADAADDGQKEVWYKQFANFVGDSIINSNELAVGATVFAANLLLGYDSETAMQQGLKYAQSNRATRQASEAADLKRTTDFEDWQKKQDVQADSRVELEGIKQANRQVIEQQKAGVKLTQDAIKAQNKFVEASRKYNVSQAKSATSKGGFAYDEKNGRPYISATSQKLAAEHTDFLKEYGFTDFESDVATGMFETAMRRASEAARSGKDIRSIKPYLHAAMMTQESGLGEGAFSRIDKKTGIPTPIDTGNINALNKIIQGNLPPGSSRQKRLIALGDAYNALAPDARQKFENEAATRGDVTGFYLYARKRAEELQRKIRG